MTTFRATTGYDWAADELNRMINLYDKALDKRMAEALQPPTQTESDIMKGLVFYVGHKQWAAIMALLPGEATYDHKKEEFWGVPVLLVAKESYLRLA